MGNFNLRKEIRKIISEFFNNASVYPDDQNKFPKFDGSEKTPSDLDAEFEEEFLNTEGENSEESVGLYNQNKNVNK